VNGSFEIVNLMLPMTALADQRPICFSEPVIPLETADFDSDGLAGDREWVMSTLNRRS